MTGGKANGEEKKDKNDSITRNSVGTTIILMTLLSCKRGGGRGE